MGEWLVMVVPKAPRFPRRVIDTLIVWFVELSVVAVGSAVLPAVFDKYSATVVVSGLLASLSSIGIAIVLSWRSN